MNTLYISLLAALGACVLGFFMAYINHRNDYAQTDTGAGPFAFSDLISGMASAFLGLWFSAYIGIYAGLGVPTLTAKLVGLIAAVASTILGALQARIHGRVRRAAANSFKAPGASDAGAFAARPCLPEETAAEAVDVGDENDVTSGSTAPQSMFTRARFYYSLGKSGPLQQKGVRASVLIASGGYFRTIQSAVALAEHLRKQLVDAGINFIDSGSDSAEIEFGDTDYDKYMMRVLLHIEIEQLSPDEARVALEKAGFCENLPSRF